MKVNGKRILIPKNVFGIPSCLVAYFTCNYVEVRFHGVVFEFDFQKSCETKIEVIVSICSVQCFY